MAQAAVFLDRDGTLIRERDYLHDPDQVELEAGAVEMLGDMRGLGLAIVVITNQSGVGRGLFTADAVAAVHRRIDRLLGEAGARVDAWYVCPHAPRDACRCRKPSSGLVDDAARDLGLDPASSFIVGDKITDVRLARKVGAVGILVTTGHGAADADIARREGYVVCANLSEAGRSIEQHIQRGAHASEAPPRVLAP